MGAEPSVDLHRRRARRKAVALDARGASASVESTTRINRVEDSGLASEHPTEVRPTVVASGRELCSNCGAPLAADQHYCTECGQRRGAPRFPFMDGVAQRRREAQLAPPPPRPRLTTNSTLIAGIATLLLAMGIGVLIGRSGNSSNPKAPPVQVVSVAGGASGAAGASNAGTTPTATTSSAAAAQGAATAKATHTATKGIFTTKAPPPKVVTVGGACQGKQAGCQGGKFTGNFFGQ